MKISREKLIEQYQAELLQTQNKLKHINRILKIIYGARKVKTKEFKTPDVDYKPKKHSKAEYGPRIKSLNWNEFLLDFIKSNKMLYSLPQLVEAGLKHFNLKPSNRYKIKALLNNLLGDNPKIKGIQLKENELYYAPNEWFDGPVLKSVFKKRFK